MARRERRFVRLILCILLAASTAGISSKVGFAQSASAGAIVGKVTDPSGAVVSDAKVIAKNVQTGSSYETVSASTGDYRFQNVLPGTYDVTATATGFKQTVRTGIAVQVASLSPLNIEMSVGGQ